MWSFLGLCTHVETYGVRLLCGIAEPLSETHAVRLYKEMHQNYEKNLR